MRPITFFHPLGVFGHAGCIPLASSLCLLAGLEPVVLFVIEEDDWCMDEIRFHVVGDGRLSDRMGKPGV